MNKLILQHKMCLFEKEASTSGRNGRRGAQTEWLLTETVTNDFCFMYSRPEEGEKEEENNSRRENHWWWNKIFGWRSTNVRIILARSIWALKWTVVIPYWALIALSTTTTAKEYIFKSGTSFSTQTISFFRCCCFFF